MDSWLNEEDIVTQCCYKKFIKFKPGLHSNCWTKTKSTVDLLLFTRTYTSLMNPKRFTNCTNTLSESGLVFIILPDFFLKWPKRPFSPTFTIMIIILLIIPRVLLPSFKCSDNCISFSMQNTLKRTCTRFGLIVSRAALHEMMVHVRKASHSLWTIKAKRCFL